ncbi:DUF397 domain-containing protein [Streptomyces canus]|uniref:DUF397 domain-containing protein n=1 Tax=Streptomyces canus TaxID=58343 RepID=UPI0032486C93
MGGRVRTVVVGGNPGAGGGGRLPAAETTSTAAVRDSKTPAGPILTVGPAVFTTFVNWTSTTAE